MSLDDSEGAEEATTSRNVESDEEMSDAEERVERRRKPGIVFLPTIPPYMTVLKLREILGEFGEIGRVFLQPEESKSGKKKKKHTLNFSEGWVEFKSKRVAKHVAATLNNNRICTRKKSKFYDHIWNVKYLPRFKWVHLSERLAYERAVHKQRMQAETMQAKREASHFLASVERSEKIRRFKRKDELHKAMAERGFELPQRLLADEHKTKRKPQEKSAERTQLLHSLFGSKSKK